MHWIIAHENPDNLCLILKIKWMFHGTTDACVWFPQALRWILPALHLWLNRVKGLTVDCWCYLDLSFLLKHCLYPVSFLALLIWKQIQHSLPNSVSKFIYILKPVLNSCFPWIPPLLFCNIHSLHFSCYIDFCYVHFNNKMLRASFSVFALTFSHVMFFSKNKTKEFDRLFF